MRCSPSFVIEASAVVVFLEKTGNIYDIKSIPVMYRYLIAAIVGIVLSFIAYLQMQTPSEEHLLVGAFLLLLFTYFSIVSILGFIVSRAIKKMRPRMGN